MKPKNKGEIIVDFQEVLDLAAMKKSIYVKVSTPYRTPASVIIHWSLARVNDYLRSKMLYRYIPSENHSRYNIKLLDSNNV